MNNRFIERVKQAREMGEKMAEMHLYQATA
jgi:hypothetical protein